MEDEQSMEASLATYKSQVHCCIICCSVNLAVETSETVLKVE